jgi:hypothetical protein
MPLIALAWTAALLAAATAISARRVRIVRPARLPRRTQPVLSALRRGSDDRSLPECAAQATLTNVTPKSGHPALPRRARSA